MTHRLRGYALSLILFVLPGACIQADDGWQLLFGENEQALSRADQLAIYQHLGLTRSADGKDLLVMGGEEAGPARFTVQLEDINADGHAEVFVIGGNTFLSGSGGSSVWLFTRSAPEGSWQMHLGITAAPYRMLARRDSAYPDLRFTGTGTCDSVWRWDGMTYQYHADIASGAGGCDQPP